VAPSGIRAGVAGGLLLGVASVFTLVTGRYKVAAIADCVLLWHRQTLPILKYRWKT